MEAWKFADSELLQQPAAALSATAERWGLEIFPKELVAIEGYWDASLDKATGFWPDYLYYPCDDRISLCREAAACNTTCREDYILIEGIGRTTTGPADTDIVGLCHGAVCLFIIIVSAATMGCLRALLLEVETFLFGPKREYDGQRSSGPSYSEDGIPSAERHHTSGGGRRRRERQDLVAGYYAPEPAAAVVSVRAAELREAQGDKAREVARCAALLRDMFALDLKIWSMESTVREADGAARRAMEEAADAVFAEVRAVVKAWSEQGGGGPECGIAAPWSAEEQALVDRICWTVYEHEGKRYS